VDESEAVLRRLERIEELDRRGAPASDLVGEFRALVAEAEAWSRREGGDAGASAVDDLRRALQHEMIEE
jgi:predicted Ser/Thr protein kinase